MTRQSIQFDNLETIAIVGCGIIGRRIALFWALRNKKVAIFDINNDTALDARKWIHASFDKYKASNGHPVGEVNVAPTIEHASRGAWMVIECTPETVETKREVIGQIDKFSDPSAIITTNSSSIKSGDLVNYVSESSRGRVLNCHYFLPPEIPVVELMTCGSTTGHTLETLISALSAAGLHPITAKAQSTGLVGNRVWAAIKREVMMVLAEGVVNPEDIDTVFRLGFQTRLGPCEMMDQVGLHTVCDIEDHYLKERVYLPSYAVDFIRQNYVAKGHIGRTIGRGLYNYTELERSKGQPLRREELVGAWELAEYATSSLADPARKVYPLGDHLKGIIIYTLTGHTSVHLQLSGDLPIDTNRVPEGLPRDLTNTGMRSLSYSGPFSVREEDGRSIVQHHLTYSSLPSWQGTTQRRLAHVEKQGNAEFLVLGLEETTQFGGEEWRVMLRWRHLPNVSAS
ncbi:3-hydroxyacyl-CoA dehydrogenase [Aspergillus sclerotialis]|uniref:3-hydroxyacyl-CoA dehydrogenase n=1 Tax=Aspergillus sclerotialis TaxID=2070753 RepID=A0A3A2ZTB6_9EURO|nr:3-hydroxyacyl-CoA dehydrogenase [Aspergillus sclerotialis]